jgi:hypothetical protein
MKRDRRHRKLAHRPIWRSGMDVIRKRETTSPGAFYPEDVTWIAQEFHQVSMLDN